MTRVFAGITLAAFLSGAAFGQSTRQRPTFEIADVHVSPRINTINILGRIGSTLDFGTSLRDGRYEVRNATMVDLIQTAYSVEADRVAGGPNWLELDRFDVTARVSPNTPQATLKLMLQSLLADRFKLVVHNDTKPMPRLVLSVGKGKPKLKEADASGRTGCQSQLARTQAPAPGDVNVIMMNVSCRNITMEAFTAELKGIGGGGYVTNVVVDSTGLKGSWDFDIKLTEKGLLQRAGSGGITVFDAIDKQLGLKLEEQKLPTAVIVVDRVNQKPSANPPAAAQKLPPLPPAEFEVALIKPTGTGERLQSLGFQTGGRVNISGGLIPLKSLISSAWNLDPNQELIGAPKWLDSARFDIMAKMPAASLGANGGPPPVQDLASMLQALLVDRFKMKIHYEDQLVTAYALVAAKPKLKKADSSTRTGCKLGNGPAAGPPGLPSRTVSCQNMTMAQFADQLQSIAGPYGGPYVHYPVVDATGLDGGWDFSFAFSPIAASQAAGTGNPFLGGPAGPTASDPVGGVSLFEAIDKQLGLKLEAQKRTYPVFVIDHIEEKPTDN